MSEILIVGMADCQIGKAPVKLRTLGLGSCVGICIYDLEAQIGGMAHIMLPVARGKVEDNPAKYADTGIKLLIDVLIRRGGNKARFQGKIAGGASMFNFVGENKAFKIGEDNVEKVKQELKRFSIPLISQAVGGTIGRTITLDVKTGGLLVKTINQGEKLI